MAGTKTQSLKEVSLITRETLKSEILLAQGHGRLLPPKNPEGIIVLSAPPARNGGGEICEWTYENIHRVFTGQQVLSKYTDNEWEAPWVMLNGERNQLPMMLQTALACGIPADNICLTDCGARPVGNTKTQFQVLQNDKRLSYDIVVITSWYHMARVARTIPKNAPQSNNLRYWVYSAPPPFPYIVTDEMIDKEIDRIIQYIEAGDLVETPPAYLPELVHT